MNERTNELTNSLNEKIKNSELIIQDLSKRLIHDLNMGRGDYIERRDDYLQELDGADKFPNKIAHDMIRAGWGNEVLRHIDKFDPTQKLAQELVKDMLKNGFYEDKDKKDLGYHDYVLSDRLNEWKDFLSRFNDLDNTTALLVLRLINKNIYPGAGYIYREHLGDCFNLEHFTGLDEEVLKRISERGKIPTDEEKKRFIGIDEEKREKYAKMALAVQKNRDNEWDDLAQELEETY